jgi:hypothetical protein
MILQFFKWASPFSYGVLKTGSKMKCFYHANKRRIAPIPIKKYQENLMKELKFHEGFFKNTKFKEGKGCRDC